MRHKQPQIYYSQICRPHHALSTLVFLNQHFVDTMASLHSYYFTVVQDGKGKISMRAGKAKCFYHLVFGCK
jgi:prenyltransferase beta subunit